VRLAAAFGTSSPEGWLRMQAQFDLWQIQKRNRIHVGLLIDQFEDLSPKGKGKATATV
jgi:plasmid maintenance system antidote protein VapI